MSNRQTANSTLNNPSENENDDNTNPAENNTETLLCETSMEPNTNPTDETQQNPLQIWKSCYFEILTGQRPKLTVELPQQLSAVFRQNKLNLKKNVYDYDISKELKLQIKYYENKKWIVIEWYYN